VAADGCCLLVHSERPEYQCAVLRAGCDVQHFQDKFATVHVLPSAADQIGQLEKLGYVESSGFSYMMFRGSVESWKTLLELGIEKAATPAQAADFTHVQAAAFIGPELYAQWYPWLHSWNLKNYRSEDQGLYVGYIEGKAVGTCMSLIHDGVAGLYAVGTLAEYRKLGIAGALMKQAVLDAHSRGCEAVTLQVVTGSYAESFYEKLGFKTEFKVRIYKRGLCSKKSCRH